MAAGRNHVEFCALVIDHSEHDLRPIIFNMRSSQIDLDFPPSLPILLWLLHLVHYPTELIELSHYINLADIRQPLLITENVILKTKSDRPGPVIQATTKWRVIPESVTVRKHSLWGFLDELNIINEVLLSCEGAFWPLGSSRCPRGTTGTYCATPEVWKWRLFLCCDASCFLFRWRIFFIERNCYY